MVVVRRGTAFIYSAGCEVVVVNRAVASNGKGKRQPAYLPQDTIPPELETLKSTMKDKAIVYLPAVSSRRRHYFSVVY